MSQDPEDAANLSPLGTQQRKVLNISSLVTQEMGQEGASPTGWQL